MQAELPAWAEWYDEKRAADGHPVRYRVIYGGRGGGKSWTTAYKLIERAWLNKERVLCTRELQNSIRDSSKKLIEECIDRLGLGAKGNGFFTVMENEIRGKNGSTFLFMGLNGKDNAIKSLEGATLVWVEEAVSVSQTSIDALIPTIRRDGSEIWWTFNPRYRTDPVDEMFRGPTTPPGTILLEVHADDNPWFPSVLRPGMDYDRMRDPEKYAHIWQGAYLERNEALVFKNWREAAFESPSDAIFYFGADWGYSRDPSVLVRCFIGRWEDEPYASAPVHDPKGKYLFVDYEAVKIGCEIPELPALFAGWDRREPTRWSNALCHDGVPGAFRGHITADNQRADTISYMRGLGFNIHPAAKGKGSIQDGVEFLKSYDIVVHTRCKNLIDELLLYSWKTDPLTGQLTDKLADEHNHVIDALRYALESARKILQPDTRSASSGPRLFAGPSGFELGSRRGGWEGPPLGRGIYR